MRLASIKLVPHKLVFKEGEPAVKLFIIKSGEVICVKKSNDRLIPVFTAKENDIIGENTMVPGSIYSYSAITLNSAEILEVPSTHFTKAFREGPEWLLQLTSTMINRFQHTANLIAENRVINTQLVDESVFTPAVEVELKKLIN
jgi:CRP-like cAMP-binding protein